MEKSAILIVGRGKLAKELLQDLSGPTISRVLRWDEKACQKEDRCIVAHAGSGRELNDVYKFCSGTGSVLLNLSTGDRPFPVAADFPLVLCPNVNLQMLRFMAMVKQSARHFAGLDIEISESHQAAKSSKPGTAIYLAGLLGVSETRIRSERDPKVQNEVLGIPTCHLDRHAYHQILIRDPEVEIRMETRVYGKSAYASGLATIIELVARSKLAPGCHDVVDLVIHGA